VSTVAPALWSSPRRRSAVVPLCVGAGVLSAAAAIALGPMALAFPVAAILAMALAREPLVLYVAFLYVGVFKDQALIQASPVDPTLGLGLLLIAVCAQRLASGRAKAVPTEFGGVLALLTLLLILGLLWTQAPEYGQEKTLRFLALTLPAALAPFFIVESRADLQKLFVATAVGAVIGAVFVRTFGSTTVTDESGDRLVFGDVGNTILTSRFLLSGALLLLLAPLLAVWLRQRALLVAAGVVLVAVAASIGSRGPLIALVLAMACTIVAVGILEPRRVAQVVILVMAGIALFPVLSLPQESRERLQNATTNPLGTLQGDVRAPLYQKAVRLTAERPLLGVGTGGYQASSSAFPGSLESYPHNIFLEASSEHGIPAALLLVATILSALTALLRRAWGAPDALERNLLYLVLGLFLINLFAAQFTGDFNDNRTFWASLGLAWLVARHRLGGGPDQEVRQAPIRPPRAVTARR
jgi:O-antigen ligase